MLTSTKATALLLTLASSSAFVAAHGSISKVTIAGKEYKGPDPYQGGGDGVIRRLTGVEPTTDLSSKDMACGLGSKPADKSANAKAGDDVEIYWVGGGGGPWPHDTGPMQTYMADCGGDCSSAAGPDLKWFKIQECGLDGGKWCQAAVKAGEPAKATIPKDLKTGSYLLRHEILALQNGFEFYPSCIQLKVEGGNATPSGGDTVSLPGAYKKSDPGISFDPYNMKGTGYPFPGPKVASIAGGSGGNGGSSGGDEGSSGGDEGSSGGDEGSSGDAEPSSDDSAPSGTSASNPAPTGVNNGGHSTGGSSGNCSAKRRRFVKKNVAKDLHSHGGMKRVKREH